MVVAAICCFSMRSPALDLVKDGNAVSTIVVPDAPTEQEQAGAERLAKYLHLSTRAELPVVKESDKPAGASIISVGHTDMAKRAGIADAGLKYDGYRLAARDGTLYLLGRDTDRLVSQHTNPLKGGAQGTLRAAFGLLDRLGFRWLQPTPQGTHVPQLKTVSVPDDLDVTYEPPFMYVHGRMNNWGDWSMANSCRTAIKCFTMGGHTWGPSIPQTLYDEHPEYFVMVNGERRKGGQYCSSSAGAQRRVADWTMGILKQGYEMVQLGQSDGFVPCECELCAELSPADQVHNAHRAIIETIGKTYPDGKVQLLIYPPTMEPPTGFSAYPPTTVAELCLTGSLQDAFGSHARALEHWQTAAPTGITVYSYNMGPWFGNGLAPRFYPELAATNMKTWIAHGVKGIYWCGGGENWGAEGPTYYVIGRMATDPALDWQAVYEEYISLTFGKAAPAMQQYYDMLYKRLADFHHHDRRFMLIGLMDPADSFVSIYSPAVLRYMRQYLNKAKQQAGDDKRALGWIRLAEFSYNHFALIAKAFHLYRAHELDPDEASLDKVRKAMIAYHAWVDEALNINASDPDFSRDYFPDLVAHHGAMWSNEKLRHNHGRLGCPPFNMDLHKKADDSAAAVAPIEDGWTLQFSDDFERDELGEDWNAVAGHWQIVDGTLVAEHPAGNSCKLVCTKAFPGSQRLEYDCCTDKPGDLSAVIGANPTGSWESGYFFGFGSNNNMSSKLLVRGADTGFYFGPIEPGTVYHVVCQRDGDTLTHIVDGKVLKTHKDPRPLTGEGHQNISLYIWEAGRIDNVRVYTKPE